MPTINDDLLAKVTFSNPSYIKALVRNGLEVSVLLGDKWENLTEESLSDEGGRHMTLLREKYAKNVAACREIDMAFKPAWTR